MTVAWIRFVLIRVVPCGQSWCFCDRMLYLPPHAANVSKLCSSLWLWSALIGASIIVSSTIGSSSGQKLTVIIDLKLFASATCGLYVCTHFQTAAIDTWLLCSCHRQQSFMLPQWFVLPWLPHPCKQVVRFEFETSKANV